MRTPEQEDSYELHVMRDAANERHGRFLNLMIEAVQIADQENFEDLRPVIRALIRRYDLKCDEKCQRDGTGWTGPIPEWAEKDVANS